MANFITVLRAGSPITTVAIIDIDNGTVFNDKAQDAKLITCNVSQVTVLPLQERDYIIHKSEKYYLHNIPEFAKDSTSTVKNYVITFFAEIYDLLDVYVLNQGAKVFPYYGNALAHLQLIIANANRIGSGWTLGEVELTEEKNLEYDWTYVRTALVDIAEAFGLEYQVDGKKIKMVKSIGRDTGLVFEVGRGKGLYGISRRPDTSKSVINRVYGVGGTRNISSNYRGGLEKNLVFEARYIQSAGVTAGTENIKEGKYFNENIFPSFTGVVKARSIIKDAKGVVTSFTITDSTIDFDVMAAKQDGINAKVSFITGSLAGTDFDISAYNLTTKVLTLLPNTDANGYVLPNDNNLPAVNQKYVFYDLNLPAAYEVKAEANLLAAATEYLEKNRLQQLVFDIEPDAKKLRDNLTYLKVGDRVTVNDPDLGSSDLLRITEISYPLIDEFDIKAVIGGSVSYSKIVKLFADVAKNAEQVQTINLGSAQTARNNARDLVKLKDLVIDPTNDKYYTGKFVAGSIEALYLSIGAKATNFNLNNVSFNPNAAGNPNSFTATAGQLVHYDIKLPSGGFTWQMAAYNKTDLVAANTYYLYAIISKETLTGIWELATTVKTAESLDGYYILQAGVLFPVKDGRRDNQITKGMVFIIGDQITAGLLKSLDGLNWINLTSGTINFGTTWGFDVGVTAPNQMTIRDAVASSEISVGSNGLTNAFISGITDEAGKSVRFGAGGARGSTNIPFKVLDDGTTYMSKAVISGDVIIGTSSGITTVDKLQFSGWKLSEYAILSDGYSNPGTPNGNNFAVIRGSSRYTGDKYNEFSFGTELVPASTGGDISQVAYIRNNRPLKGAFSPTTNVALEVRASGADKNIALNVTEGEVWIGGRKAMTVTRGFKIQDAAEGGHERIYNCEFVNGLLMNMEFVE